MDPKLIDPDLESSDFKETIILLAQFSPIFERPIKDFDFGETDYCHSLLYNLLLYSDDASYTQVDNIQKARLHYALGQLCDGLDKPERASRHYSAALKCLYEGGIDLSIKKWMELVSLYSKD